jgi:hypothetical protein
VVITASDWAIVTATLLGPILAVQAQKIIERWRDIRRQKLWVFSTLMSTRAATLTPDHIKALNMIDLVFYGTRRFGRNRRSNSEQAVLDKWKEYLDELTDPWIVEANNEARIAHRVDIFMELLENIGADVGFKFDRVQLKKGAYQPVAHNTENAEQQRLRRAAIEVFAGTKSLKMEIEKIPVNEAATNAMKEFHERLSDAMDGKRSLSVNVQDHRKGE